ncbi:MAG: hypothetical protein HPY55_12825 [Firmicutes bacterium]|nr:hypothetical protein [Bacillota bacterium]
MRKPVDRWFSTAAAGATAAKVVARVMLLILAGVVGFAAGVAPAQYRGPGVRRHHRPAVIGVLSCGQRPASPGVQAASQLLSEEGYAVRVLAEEAVRSAGGPALASEYAAIIIPEGTPCGAVSGVLVDYAAAGGSILAAHDPPPGLWRVLGIRPGPARVHEVAGEPLPPAAPFTGRWIIPAGSELAPEFDRSIIQRGAVQAYGYPPVEDEHASVSVAGDAATVLATTRPVASQPPPCSGQVLAQAPLVTECPTTGGGVALYVNARLFAHKWRSNNDFICRPVIRYFLGRKVRAPRIIPAPGGVSGLVLNMHVCSGAYSPDLGRLLARGAFPRSMPLSSHITAGPDCNRHGDGLGVNASDARGGRPYVRALARLGSVGAHGGWMHNYWAFNFARMAPGEKRRFIELNVSGLRSLVGEVVEYSAPAGAHDETVNDALALLGFKATAFPSAPCSPPTRVWFSGRADTRFWHFPYTGTAYGLCFENMTAARTPRQIALDMADLLGEIESRRQVRLFYFHPGVIAREPAMWERVTGRIQEAISSGRLTCRTMNAYVRFLDKHESARLTVEPLPGSGAGRLFTVRAPQGVDELCVAVYCGDSGEKVEDGQGSAAGWSAEYSGGWVYVRLKGESSEAKFIVR